MTLGVLRTSLYPPALEFVLHKVASGLLCEYPRISITVLKFEDHGHLHRCIGQGGAVAVLCKTNSFSLSVNLMPQANRKVV